MKKRTALNSESAIIEFQNRQLKKFAKYVLPKASYYKPYFKEGDFNWQAVPQISKNEFMSAFDGTNTCGIKLEEAMALALKAETSREFSSVINGITVGLSTGTSGKRGLFLVSENERALWVALVMSRVIKPRLFHKQKVAFFLRANSNLYSSVASSLFEFKYFDIFKPLPELLQELDTFSPAVLAGQPSLLVDIAKAQAEQKINIHPHQVISFAEVLHQNDKDYIVQNIPAQLTEVYQCTEGFLGVTCEEGTMHLNEDFIRFEKEWIDDDKFYPIITDFSRQSQALVKYKLNDVLQIKKTACACGSKRLAIEKIMGRDDDVLILKDQKIYPDLIARRISLATNNFQYYTIIQVANNKLSIHIETLPSDFEKTCRAFNAAIKDLLSDFGITDTDIEFHQGVQRIPGNKLRKIRREFST